MVRVTAALLLPLSSSTWSFTRIVTYCGRPFSVTGVPPVRKLQPEAALVTALPASWLTSCEPTVVVQSHSSIGPFDPLPSYSQSRSPSSLVIEQVSVPRAPPVTVNDARSACGVTVSVVVFVTPE